MEMLKKQWILIVSICMIILSIVVYISTKHSIQIVVQNLEIQHNMIQSNLQLLSNVEYEQSKILQTTTNKIEVTERMLQNIHTELKSISNKFYSMNRYYHKTETLLVDLIRNANHKVTYQQAMKIANAIIKSSNEFDVPIPYIVSVMWIESHFNINSRSNKNCIGLMQINYKVWNDIVPGGLDPKQLYDIEYNIMIGTYILKHYYEKTGSWFEAIKRYYGNSRYSKIYAHMVHKKVRVVKHALQKVGDLK